MTNASAQTIAWQAKYDPFGVPVAVTVSPVNNQRLPGQWFQSEDGLSYNWHRTYDPTLGRYTQADPLGFVDGPGIYNYAGGSPVMKVDPKGEYTFLATALIGGGLGLAAKYYFDGDCATLTDYAWAFLGGAALGVGGKLIGPYIGPWLPRWLGGAAGRGGSAAGAGGAGLGDATGAAGSGSGLGAGIGEGAGKGAGWSLGQGKGASKWANQMKKRGWTPKQIDDAIKSGKNFSAPNKLNPENGATRYVNPDTGRSVVLDNKTGEVIHIGGDGFGY